MTTLVGYRVAHRRWLADHPRFGREEHHQGGFRGRALNDPTTPVARLSICILVSALGVMVGITMMGHEGRIESQSIGQPVHGDGFEFCGGRGGDPAEPDAIESAGHHLTEKTGGGAIRTEVGEETGVLPVGDPR